MKNIFAKVAVAACFLVPVMASAESYSSETSFDYVQKATDSDPLHLNGVGYVSVGASWSDMVATYLGHQSTYQASSIAWTLTKGGEKITSGTFTDQLAGPDTGTISFSESGLKSGTYKLTLTAIWSGNVAGNDDRWNIDKRGTVHLGAATFSNVSPVPEPESYAMMLAGLGLMGTIALRRKSKDAS